MKRILFLTAAAAVLSLASCQKDVIDDNGSSGEGESSAPVFTASISSEAASKTTVDLSTGKVSWEATDEITVTDGNGKTAVYSIASIDSGTGRATFKIKSGDADFGKAPYSAVYGTAPTIAQAFSETAGKLYMTAPQTESNTLKFTVQCGLMRIILTKTGQSVKSITVTGIPTGGSETAYTLSCNDAQSIASGKDFFVALPAGKYTKVEIVNSSDLKCTLKAAGGVNVALNTSVKLIFGSDKLVFIPEGALPGVFSISDEKKVRFSQGNLTYNVEDKKWAFYGNQYDMATGYDPDLISLFTWGYDSIYSTYPDYAALPSSIADWGSAIDNNGTWRTLSIFEWLYLFTSRPYGFLNATVVGEEGVLLFPDNSSINALNCPSKFDAAEWVEMQSAGLVFLPYAGTRNGDTVRDFGAGRYWSFSLEVNPFRAYCAQLSPLDVPLVSLSDGDAYSVRLVTEIQQ